MSSVLTDRQSVQIGIHYFMIGCLHVSETQWLRLLIKGLMNTYLQSETQTTLLFSSADDVSAAELKVLLICPSSVRQLLL